MEGLKMTRNFYSRSLCDDHNAQHPIWELWSKLTCPSTFNIKKTQPAHMLQVHKSVFSALNYLSREEKAPLYGDAVAAYFSQDKGDKVSFPFKQKQ